MAVATTLHLKAEIREAAHHGKEWAKKARKAGKVPAVLYGPHDEPLSICVDSHELQMLIQAAATERVLLEIELSDGTVANAFFKEFQREPVSDRIIHVDFLRVNMNEEVSIRIPTRAIGGIPAGVKLGGMVEHIRHHIFVKAKPSFIPPVIEVDLTDLVLGHAIHISDLPPLENGEYLGEPKWTVFTIAAKNKTAKEALKLMQAEAKAAAEESAAAAEGAEGGEEK